jgi:MurNAc alpha-1-phosphate uridylyltransferase
MKAMILAAGRGERLKPLTDTTPKALIEVKGQPLIVHHIQNLKLCGINDIVINIAYLGSQIEQCLGSGSEFGVKITYSREVDGGLETGGGIVNALPLLGLEEPFITLNADVYCDYPLATLKTKLSALAHLVLVNNPVHNPNGDFAIENQLLSNGHENKPYTFAGIAIYHPQFFEGLEVSRYSIAPIIREKAKLKMISAECYDGMWFDIGTLTRLQTARQALEQT